MHITKRGLWHSLEVYKYNCCHFMGREFKLWEGEVTCPRSCQHYLEEDSLTWNQTYLWPPKSHFINFNPDRCILLLQRAGHGCATTGAFSCASKNLWAMLSLAGALGYWMVQSTEISVWKCNFSCKEPWVIPEKLLCAFREVWMPWGLWELGLPAQVTPEFSFEPCRAESLSVSPQPEWISAL